METGGLEFETFWPIMRQKMIQMWAMVKTWLTAHKEITFLLSRADRSITVRTAQTANNYVRYSSKTVRLPVIAHCSVKPAKLKPWVETVTHFDGSDGALPDGFRKKVEYGPELHEKGSLPNSRACCSFPCRHFPAKLGSPQWLA